MPADTHYEVTIEETVVETRIVRVPRSEAATPQEAADRAYAAWVGHGRCDEGPTIAVHERTCEIDGQFYGACADV